LADGLLLSAPLGTRRGLGWRAPHPRHGRPGAGGPGSLAFGGDPRQPDGQDGRSKGGSKGYDAGKRIHGRKRHILTDTDGRLLAVEVHGADIQDRDGAKGVLKRSRRRFPFVEHVFADGGYAGKLVSWARDKTHVVLEIVRRMPWMKGFVVLRRRWVVERTFAWIIKCRRFVRDYEQLTRTAETLITIAAVATLVRRWP
jgi:transposase